MSQIAKQLKHKGTRGQATVEFAFVLIVLLAMLYGILEISRLILINAELENAAREATHYVSRHPGVSGEDLKAAIVGPKLVLIDSNSSDLVVANPTFPRGGIGLYLPIQVTVTYTWTSLINIMPDVKSLSLKPLGPLRMQASSTRLIEVR